MKRISELQITRLLRVVARYDDLHRDLFWDRELNFYVNCNDVFAWGSADAEPITSNEDIDLLARSYQDTENIYGDSDLGHILYCARKRGMRPQGAFYEYIDAKHHHLFDECGPPRQTGFGNPKPQPKEK